MTDNLFSIILADDLTGAMEVGLQSTPALVLNEVEKVTELSFDQTIVVNIQTRELSFSETQKALQKTLSFIPSSKICYYKVDSTLRGEIGAAVDVLRREKSIDLVLVVPAIPHTGRITKKGVHYLVSDGQEIPIHKTVYARDIRLLPENSSIVDLIQYQTSQKVELLSLSTIRKGTSAIIDVLSAFKKNTIVVADATTEDDLDAIARALMNTDRIVLPVGSAGLFAALCRVKKVKRQKGKGLKRISSKMADGKILFLIGSLNPQTDKQVEFLLSSEKRAKLIELNSSELFSDKTSRQDEICRVRQIIKEAMKAGFHPVLRASRDSTENLKPDIKVAWTLGETIDDTEVLSVLRLIFVTGGETAVTLTKVLGTTGMTVEGIVEPFIPIGRFVGGKVDGLPVVTKAGGFGSIELLKKLSAL